MLTLSYLPDFIHQLIPFVKVKLTTHGNQLLSSCKDVVAYVNAYGMEGARNHAINVLGVTNDQVDKIFRVCRIIK